MRFVVFLLGIIAIIATAFIGYFYIEGSLEGILLAYVPQDYHETVLTVTTSPLGVPDVDTGMFMLIASGYGLFGVVLAFGRCGWQGALLLILPALTTAIMNPFTLAFTGLQISVGLLAFFVFPLPLPAEKPRNAASREDDEPKPKPKAKPRPTDEDDEDDRPRSQKSKSRRDDDDDDEPSRGKPKPKSKRRDEDDE